MKMKIAKILYTLLGEDFGGTPSPPGSTQRFQFGEIDDGNPMYTATTYNNDGFELWICYTGGKWLFSCRKEYALDLAKFILWDWWILATWCGVKRRLWYWALRNKHGSVAQR